MDFTKYSDFAIVYASEYGLKVVAALAIFFIGKWGVRKVTAFVKKLMLKAHVDFTLVEFLENVIYFALLIVIILASLNALGINTTSFLAVFGAASLAVGLALKDSLSNIGAAVLIIIFKPFKVGDVVDAAGASGKIDKIDLFSTIIINGDNQVITIPNSSIIKSNIINYSDKPIRRINHIFSIDYSDDLKLAKDTLMQIIETDERVLKDPAPLVAVNELADNSVNLLFRVWVKTEQYWDVHFDMLEKVKLAFDEKGISIPFPQISVHLQGQKSEN